MVDEEALLPDGVALPEASVEPFWLEGVFPIFLGQLSSGSSCDGSNSDDESLGDPRGMIIKWL